MTFASAFVWFHDQGHRHLNDWDNYDWKIVEFIPHYTGALSVAGSFIIIVNVLSSPRRRSNTYHCLILGLSLYDFLSSFALFMGRWAQPISHCSEDGCGRIGNIESCAASGFFHQLGALAIPFYNVALVTYYSLAIKGRWGEERLKKYFEQYIHVVILIIAFIVAVIPLRRGDYNPYYWLCINAPWDWDNENQTYLRGNIDSMITYSILNLVVVSVCSIYLVYTMIDLSCTFSRNTSTMTENQNTKKAKAKINFMVLLYTIPFYITWIIPSIFFFMTLGKWYGYTHLTTLNFGTQYFCNVWIATFMPLQGFLNAIIYYLPRCVSKNEMNTSYVQGVELMAQQRNNDQAAVSELEKEFLIKMYAEMC